MPKIHPSALVAPEAIIIGDVKIGEETSVWPGCVLRGDMHKIRIGARTNIQDGTVIHVTAGGRGVTIGDDVTIGHMALLHDCTVESHAFIGMKAVLMDGSRMESRSVLAAASLLTQGKSVPSGQLWAGSPARYKRDLTPEDKEEFYNRAAEYLELMRSYR